MHLVWNFGVPVSEQEREVAARVKFNVPEQVLIDDRINSLINAAVDLKAAVDANNGNSILRAWNLMSEDMTYIGTILNLKGSAAARQWIEETGIGDE